MNEVDIVQVFSKSLLTAVLKLGLTGVCVGTSYLCKPACVLLCGRRMLKCDPLLVKDHVGVTNVLA